MVDCAKNPLVVPFCTIPGRLVEIQGLGIGLENCQKSLNEYLDSKRRIFPRFYFISTDELLSILGSSEPSAVQNHIIKVGIGWVILVFGIGASPGFKLVGVGGGVALVGGDNNRFAKLPVTLFLCTTGRVYIYICGESCHKS